MDEVAISGALVLLDLAGGHGRTRLKKDRDMPHATTPAVPSEQFPALELQILQEVRKTLLMEKGHWAGQVGLLYRLGNLAVLCGGICASKLAEAGMSDEEIDLVPIAFRASFVAAWNTRR